jgi:two-component system cell cycle response regulator
MDSPQIILVEDDTNVAKLVELGLKRDGFQVQHASTLEQARPLTAGGNWDILLLDRRLPDGDGVELCNEVRPANPHGYIMLITGESSKEAKLAGFGCGADDYVVKPFHMEELVARVRAGCRIVELQKRLLASNRQLEELARTDPLTGLRNRRTFDQEFITRFEHARRYQRPIAVAMIDIDHFKQTNDEHGHQTGDEVLQKVASVMRRCTRQSDLLARFGGEEFVIVLPETPLFEALQFAEKIRSSVAAQALPGDIRATVSIGIAAMPHTMFPSPESLLRAADEALYRAKESGRNRVEFEKRVKDRSAEKTTPLRSDRP